MRPTGLESIRAVQAALAEIVVPELSSAFAQDAAATVQMLLESLAGDWDTAAEDLRRDNERWSPSFRVPRRPQGCPDRNETLSSIVTEIEQHSRESEEVSLTISSLAARNDVLMGLLERVLVAFEDLTERSAYENIDGMRREIYSHLRHVATRGWSFWDVASFRERMVAVRSARKMTREALR
jgi:hypothetical protein